MHQAQTRPQGFKVAGGWSFQGADEVSTRPKVVETHSGHPQVSSRHSCEMAYQKQLFGRQSSPRVS